MSSRAMSRDNGAYSTGRMAAGPWTSHPGGIELTLRTLELAGIRCGSRVLDLGCGAGDSVVLLRAHELEAFGVDCAFMSRDEISAQFCERGLAEELEFSSRSFDAVLMECSLSVMQSPLRVLDECLRVLRPGGKVMISDLYARNPAEIAAVRALPDSCIAGMLVRGELERWLQDCGFAVTCFEDHSKELRESVARYILEHDLTAGLWGCADGDECKQIEDAMKRVRAGYFTLTAVQTTGCRRQKHHGR